MKHLAPAVVACSLVFSASVSAQGQKEKFVVTFHATSAPQAVSPEGFVEGSDRWLTDSATDIRKAMDGEDFRPNKDCPGSKARYLSVSDPTTADIVLTVAARGVSAESLGQRTTLQFYRGVALAETVPTFGVTRWVSMVLSVGTYRRELIAWHTNQSRWSVGAWRADAKFLARMSACWVMVNEAKIRERQQERATVASNDPR